MPGRDIPPGRDIQWDLEADLNQLQDQGEVQQDGLQRDREDGVQQEIRQDGGQQQHQPMPWDANHEDWQPSPSPVNQRTPAPARNRPHQPGPDFKDAEVRAAIGYLTGIFKIPMLDSDSPDLWVENVRDALDGSGMGAVFVAADCRDRTEVPVRVRLRVEAIDRWKLEFVWPIVRRSLNSVPSIFKRSGRCKFPDVEGLIRTVLDLIQKRSQGVETRLRDEIGAANLADYTSLASYIADIEGKFSKLAAHGVTVTQSEQRYLLLRGLTADYNGVRASILGFRDRTTNPLTWPLPFQC